MNTFPNIQQLDETTANRIAAGEVIERPAAVVKELVENAIDAGARHIQIRFKDGGKTIIEVHDDGSGIASNQLSLAIERHATSKISNGDLIDIRSFGFRGEALPSIGAVARLEINSKQDGDEASTISVEGGKLFSPSPSRRNVGTSVVVEDLFFATPARLKFLSSDRAEMLAIGDAVKRLAIANPAIGFELTELRNEGDRVMLKCEPNDANYEHRIKAILGKSTLDDTLPLIAEHNGVKLHGFIGLPTAARGSASGQYYFVNNRPVKDKLFFGAIKGAYSDLLPSGKFPFIVLYMEIPPNEIDVNVHPAKSEIRFHGAPSIRSFVLNSIRHRFAEEGLRGANTLSQSISTGFTPRAIPSRSFSSLPQQQYALGGFDESPAAFAPQTQVEENNAQLPLGVARAQYHQNYIIAETEDGLVIIDQHAAHERLVYEQLKSQYAEKRLQQQRLLVPEIISLGAIERAKLLSQSEALAELGFEIEAFGDDAIAVQAVPVPLSNASPQKLVMSILDEIDEDPAATLTKKVDEILASVACHGSVRSGRNLRPEEMNALLREMESTPNSGTCNHGRPTFIKLDLKFLEARFGR